MKILKLDKTGHTTIDSATGIDVQAEFDALVKSGYAMFLNDEKIKSYADVPQGAEVLALAPLVGG